MVDTKEVAWRKEIAWKKRYRKEDRAITVQRKVWVCNLCDQSFVSSKQFNTHFQIDHREVGCEHKWEYWWDTINESIHKRCKACRRQEQARKFRMSKLTKKRLEELYENGKLEW